MKKKTGGVKAEKRMTEPLNIAIVTGLENALYDVYEGICHDKILKAAVLIGYIVKTDFVSHYCFCHSTAVC